MANLRGTLEEALASGAFSSLPEEEKRKVTGLVTYLISENAVIRLEDFIKNAERVSAHLAQMTTDSYMVGNIACASTGLTIGGVSLMKGINTKNKVARIFYCTSTVCGSTAAIAGSLKAYSGTCGLSIFAVGGDLFGGACLYLGNKAQKIGDMVDGKRPFSWRPRSFARRPNYKSGMGYRGLSFITAPGSGDFSFADVPQLISNIPYETIIIIGGTVFTIYSYIRSTKIIYRYLKAKFAPKIDRSKVIHKSALLLVDSINNTAHTKKLTRIYSAALKLEYSRNYPFYGYFIYFHL